MSFLRMIFAWWHHATLGTLTTIWFSGTFVGTDKFGNRYYQSKNGARVKSTGLSRSLFRQDSRVSRIRAASA